VLRPAGYQPDGCVTVGYSPEGFTPAAACRAASSSSIGAAAMTPWMPRTDAISITSMTSLLFQDFDQDWHTDVHGVNAEGGGQLKHFHDLLLSHPEAQGGLDVRPDAWQVHVRSVRIDGQVNEFLDLIGQVVLPPRHCRQVQVREQKLRVEPEDGFPGLAPGAAYPDDFRPDLFLASGKRHFSPLASCRSQLAICVWSASDGSSSAALAHTFTAQSPSRLGAPTCSASAVAIRMSLTIS